LQCEETNVTEGKRHVENTKQPEGAESVTYFDKAYVTGRYRMLKVNDNSQVWNVRKTKVNDNPRTTNFDEDLKR